MSLSMSMNLKVFQNAVVGTKYADADKHLCDKDEYDFCKSQMPG